MLSILLATALAADPPSGWVELSDAVPGIRYDIRYATANNFTEAVLPGYCEPQAWLLEPAATALASVQTELADKGLGLVVYDAYRPLRGTLGMVDWATRTDQVHLLDGGYIARRSGHNKGATIDLSVVDLATGEPLDMGTPFDSFSEASHTRKATGKALENRMLLLETMSRHGFKNYWREWWHYTWQGEVPSVHHDHPYCDVEATPSP